MQLRRSLLWLLFCLISRSVYAAQMAPIPSRIAAFSRRCRAISAARFLLVRIGRSTCHRCYVFLI